MTGVRRRAVLACCAALLALHGCGDDGPPPPPEHPPPARPGSAYFVGTGEDGVGATLDLEGQDPVTEAVDAALRARDGAVGEGPVVGVASVVNEGPGVVPAPTFIAQFEGGGALALEDARAVVAESGGPAARRALRLLGRPSVLVPAGGADTIYVVLRGAAPGEVDAVRMVVGPGRIVMLQARPR
ncbi:hypothetical protein [Miltoncostaea oceani]|uniref:hypothetical protein n=1 Tax=Miltoncostaea oceani TaxID=2843216 RepID=UPI001C3D8AE1|nr:hypothetical protein [Miltoncostaea oceani]